MQTFVSSLSRPWVLVRAQAGRVGHRTPSRVAWLEYKNPDGTYDGGVVELGRYGWRFRYKRQRKIKEAEILYWFPHPKVPVGPYTQAYYGPSQARVRAAKRTLPIITE